MAQVYHKPPYFEPYEAERGAQLPPNLPGLKELGDFERGKTLIDEIQHNIHILQQELHFDLLSEKALANLIHEGDYLETKEVLLAVHRELHRVLATQDPRFAKGFDLGRMLADTVLLSYSADQKTLLYEFNHDRLQNAYQWLNDLHSLLPDHASYGVSGSLKNWEDWIKGNKGFVPKGESAHERFRQALHDQGESWRQLLCGEKPGMDFLVAEDYKAAGNQVSKHFLSLIFGFIREWWYAIALFVATVGGVVYLIVRYTPHGDTRLPAFILATATTLGISWKTVASTLGQVAKKAEGPLWNAEVNEAIVIATTHLPKLETRNLDSSKALYIFPGETSV